MTKSKVEELAYQYATGNGRASFPDTYQEKAFIAGWQARDPEIEKLVGTLKVIQNAWSDAQVGELAGYALEEYRKWIK